MLAEFRAAVFDLIDNSGLAPVWDVIPDDPNELPCIVVGRPFALQTATAVVFDVGLECYVLGRRQQAGGSEQELTALADAVWLLFNGTRGTQSLGVRVAVRTIYPQDQTITEQRYPCFRLTIESSIATC